MRIRLGILLGEFMLGTIAGVAMWLGYEPVAAAAVGGICAVLPKLVDSEEKTENS